MNYEANSAFLSIIYKLGFSVVDEFLYMNDSLKIDYFFK
jgi:hypothetical protein